MKLAAVAIRDSAADAFVRPFFMPSTGMAVRAFQDALKQPDSGMVGHEGDYELFHLGWFDEDSGKFENMDAPRSLARGSDYKTRVSDYKEGRK